MSEKEASYGKARFGEIESTDLYNRACSLADEIWLCVRKWDHFDRKTVGEQLCRSIDSLGANLVEGDGRQTLRDSSNFFVIARASTREARHWIRRAIARNLVPAESGNEWVEEALQLLRMVHGLVRYRKSLTAEVHENSKDFGTENFDSNIIDDFELDDLTSSVPRSLGTSNS